MHKSAVLEILAFYLNKTCQTKHNVWYRLF